MVVVRCLLLFLCLLFVVWCVVCCLLLAVTCVCCFSCDCLLFPVGVCYCFCTLFFVGLSLLVVCRLLDSACWLWIVVV